MSTSVAIITFNEEANIEHCLQSVSWADEIVLIDSGSTDRTVEIAKLFKCKIFSHPFRHFAEQKNEALKHCTGKWILSIDADEMVTTALKDEILSTTSNPNNTCDGYYVRRQNHFLGKPLRFGRQGKDKILRLVKNGKGSFKGAVHELLVVSGKICELTHHLEHSGTQTLKQYFEKLRFYTELEAKKAKFDNNKPNFFKAILYPPAMWLTDYIFYAGFLDGWHGFLYHGLSCYYGWLKNFKAIFYKENSYS